jgi:hypothetical protein
MPAFHVEFVARPPRRWLGWAVLAAGSAVLALSAQYLADSRELLRSFLAAEPTRSAFEQDTSKTPMTFGDDMDTRSLAVVEVRRQLGHPWQVAFAAADSIRGEGTRVVSFEHDARTAVTRLIVEVARPAQIDEVLGRLAATSDGGSSWSVEQVAANGSTIEVRLSRNLPTK